MIPRSGDKSKRILSQAELLSAPGRGIASISNMLNVTRLHNAAASVGYMRRYGSFGQFIVFPPKHKFKKLNRKTLQNRRSGARLLVAPQRLRPHAEGLAAAHANARGA